VAVLYNTYYLGGKWYQNPDHKYLSMMVVEKAGTLHILTFHQGSVVTSEDFVWSEPDKVNFPPGPVASSRNVTIELSLISRLIHFLS
jgi:hypothetical protein